MFLHRLLPLLTGTAIFQPEHSKRNQNVDVLCRKTTGCGVRTHADTRPLELKSNALTTRPTRLHLQLQQVALNFYRF